MSGLNFDHCKDHQRLPDYPFGVLELCFQCCHAPLDHDHEIAPCVQCAWRTPKTPLILWGTTSQPSALWAPWLCGSSWWRRPCIKRVKFQLLSVTFYPSQPKSREWAIRLCFVFSKLLCTAFRINQSFTVKTRQCQTAACIHQHSHMHAG